MPVLSPKVLQPVATATKAVPSTEKAAGSQASTLPVATTTTTTTTTTSTAGNQPMVMHLQPPYPFGATAAYSYGQAG